MTYPTDPDFRRDYQRETENEGLTARTWASIALIALIFGGVALWAYYSGDMQSAAINRPGVERSVSPTTTGQSGAPKMPATKDAAQ